MKPINADDPTCNPISSNCVIWQGPDIPCIKLCKGDTVSVVIYKLATELCKLLEQTNVSVYDLSCLQLVGCTPATFQELIQLLIRRICELENCVFEPCAPGCQGRVCRVTSGGGSGSDGCPDCVVNVCSHFYYTNQAGDTVTTMQLTDYVQAIGNRVCQLIDQIATVNAILQNHERRIATLENTPPPKFTLPQVTPVCVLPSAPTDMNIVLSALEQQFCALIGATGEPNAIYDAILAQCAGLTGSPQLGGSGSMGSLAGWNNTVQNLADAINNIWLTICDLRAAVTNIQTNCCPSGCSGISLSMTAQLNGDTLTVWFSGTIPVGFSQCPPLGLTNFTISDQSGNSIIVTGDIVAALNSLYGISWNLSSSPLNLSDDLTVTATPCLTDGISTCQYTYTEVLANQTACPVMTYNATDTQISYSGVIIATGTGVTYTVEVWDALGLTLIQSQSTLVTVPPVFNLLGTFTGLNPSTSYKVRVVITPSVGTPTSCPFATVTTLAPACPPPTNVVPSIIIS